MKIIDISQEVFSCNVYPGDPHPTAEKVVSIDKGDVYNMSTLSMCVHNGTHIDAPYHFGMMVTPLNKYHWNILLVLVM